jgi:hypothetical protein
VPADKNISPSVKIAAVGGGNSHSSVVAKAAPGGVDPPTANALLLFVVCEL